MKKLHPQSGFTLVEVLMATVILSIALLGLAKLSTSVIRSNKFSTDFTTATALAQDWIENAVSLSFADASLVDINTTNNSTAGLLGIQNIDYQQTGLDENGNTGVAGAIFTRTINIWDRADLANPASRKDIAVIVSWRDNLGTIRKITVSAVKSHD